MSILYIFKNILTIILISVFSLIFFSCSEKEEYKSFEKYGASSTLSFPDNFTVTGANNTVTLTWEKVDDATSYTIFSNTEGGVDKNDNSITSITNDNYTHDNL